MCFLFLASEKREAIEFGLYFSSGRFRLPDYGLQQVAAVRRVVDRERLRETGSARRSLPQDARKDRVEGSHADVTAAVVGEHPGDTVAHLFGGLVREGQRQDVPRLHALFDHVAMREVSTRVFPEPAPAMMSDGVIVLHGRTLRRVQPLQYR